MSWVIASVMAQTALLIYFQLHEWVHIPPWNDALPGNSQARLDVILGVVQVCLVGGTALELLQAMAIGLAVYLGWFALQVVGWWIPYLRGASEGHLRFYEKHWAGTWRFLPPIGDHPIPNAAHVGLQVMILASLLTTAAALVGAM